MILDWLPKHPDFRGALRAFRDGTASSGSWWEELVTLAGHRLDFLETNLLDRAALERRRTAGGDALPRGRMVKLALLATSTVDHLVPGIRVGGYRRGLALDVWIAPYAQLHQQVLEPSSALHAFAPDVVMIALDAEAAIESPPLGTGADEVARQVAARVASLRHLWSTLRQRGVTVVQQSVLPPGEALFGHQEARVPGSRPTLLGGLNAALRAAAEADRVLVLDLEALALEHGRRAWIDPMLWHRAKQEVAPALGPFYGDHVARVVAAARGLSRRCLVLDLDNTLWGGVVGDDGVQSLVLGHGSAEGEAFLGFQHYLRRLRERGVLLAVCSKNDEAVARGAVAEHPEMVLRPGDFAAFVANWQDKPTNLRRIAAELRLGLESFVFFDDNPMERDLVRQSLREVAVPEVPDEPALYARTLADAGYFEAAGFTDEDRQRAGSYAADARRQEVAQSATDLAGYLAGLEMRLQWRPFHEADLPRIAQLVNKTNQWNLTTRRYAEVELAALAGEPQVVTFAGRLVDKFGESGLITVVIGRAMPRESTPVLEIDTWLMSCRVLGRTVEEATLGQVAALARARGCRALVGRYIPTARNQMVADLYARMGFVREEGGAAGDGGETWRLDLDGAPSWSSPIAVEVMGA